MECPICLEHIGIENLVGQVDPCKHYYHSACIEQWAGQSNSCPTCRNLFYRVDVSRMNSKRVVSSFRVQDKLAENAAIDEIPSEFVIRPAPHHRDPMTGDILSGISTSEPISYSSRDQPDSLSGVCIICSSAQYSIQEMFACIACGGTFHSQCLGYQQEGYWFCPVCDYQSEKVEAKTATRTKTQPSKTSKTLKTASFETQKTTKPGKSILRNMGFQPKTTHSTSKYSCYVEGSFDSGDDFSEDEADSVQVTSSGRARVLENGGVRLRRQERELQSLTSEEVQSWSILESARQGIDACVEKPEEGSGVSRKKRTRVRPKTQSEKKMKEVEKEEVTRNETRNEVRNEPMSRIASLIKQIQSRPPNLGTACSPIEIPDSPSSTEPRISTGAFSGISEPRELSLEQKRHVQSHVRRLLRPHYQNSTSKSATPIRSEEEYIAINKALSRTIYRRILASEPNRFFDPNQHLLQDLCRLCWSEFNQSTGYD